MIEIEKPQIECIETPGDATYGKYVVEPLERGYGTTLGNALRRIMLSSLPGTAPTTIKIAGVQHEFSTIPGVKEDVTEIVLNVKGLLTKLHCETVKTVYIEAVGPCEVKAGDIKADGEVEVLNPDMHIATLDNGATLNMEITLSHGRGYVPADRNKPTQNVIGTIAVDSIYTPVYKVNYTVEPTRVGASSDFDKLTLEVWTDGTISARDAVSLGAKILCDHFTLFTDLSENVGSKPTVVEKAEAQRDKVLELTKKIVAENHLTCLMITHNMHDALTLGNRTLMMDHGHIVLDISGEERAHTTVDGLLDRFAENVGHALDNDRILLSKEK